MPFVTYADRYAESRGLIKGIQVALDVKFGSEGLGLMPLINPIEDLSVLNEIANAIKPATSLDEIRKLIPSPANGQN
jgi:hypothetical protein